MEVNELDSALEHFEGIDLVHLGIDLLVKDDLVLEFLLDKLFVLIGPGLDINVGEEIQDALLELHAGLLDLVELQDASPAGLIPLTHALQAIQQELQILRHLLHVVLIQGRLRKELVRSDHLGEHVNEERGLLLKGLELVHSLQVLIRLFLRRLHAQLQLVTHLHPLHHLLPEHFDQLLHPLSHLLEHLLLYYVLSLGLDALLEGVHPFLLIHLQGLYRL
mmetsp:Transcript_8764/g.8088  ORF Transcript_8764/g.8088 Transcript_8764/m.8088 type:complete len:220 (-) Transcript_8764:2167-2826(-)